MAALLIMVLAACSPKDKASKPLIAVSIHPYELILRDIFGETVDVKSIIPADASPHTWSPKPSDLKTLEAADLIVVNGLDLEHGLEQALKDRTDKTVSVAELPGVLSASHDGEINPHLWISPLRVMAVVRGLADPLQSHFPALRDTISTRVQNLSAQLLALHLQISRERGTFGNPAVVTYHDSFQYFLDDYAITLAGMVMSSPGTEPGPRELAKLADAIKSMGVRSIFVEPQLDRKAATVLAKEHNLKLIELDPLGATLKARSIMDMLLTNWERMKQGF
jgi:ABC-type Zn uptake system ZnuABC Zn-binding protein ZnuA